MNITPEEQNALVQFFGTMHAQAKQTDDMIVGSSKFVNPVSPVIRRELEQVLKSQPAQQQPIPQHVEPQFIAPQITEPVPFEASVNYTPVQEYTQPLPTTGVVVESLQVEILDALKEINLNLSRIASTLEKQNGSTKRVKNTKPR